MANTLSALRAAFITALPARIEGLRRLAERGALDEVARGGHALRGTGGSHGIDELIPLTLDLEEACSRRDAEAVSTKLSELEALAARLLSE